MTPASRSGSLSPDMSGALARLKARFLDSYPKQHAELERLADSIHAGQGDRDTVAEFTRILHRIGGTAGTIGLSSLGHAAQDGERRLLQYLDTRPTGGAFGADVMEIVDDFLVVSAEHANGH